MDGALQCDATFVLCDNAQRLRRHAVITSTRRNVRSLAFAAICSQRSLQAPDQLFQTASDCVLEVHFGYDTSQSKITVMKQLLKIENSECDLGDETQQWS